MYIYLFFLFLDMISLHFTARHQRYWSLVTLEKQPAEKITCEIIKHVYWLITAVEHSCDVHQAAPSAARLPPTATTTWSTGTHFHTDSRGVAGAMSVAARSAECFQMDAAGQPLLSCGYQIIRDTLDNRHVHHK